MVVIMAQDNLTSSEVVLVGGSNGGKSAPPPNNATYTQKLKGGGWRDIEQNFRKILKKNR